MRIFTTLTCLVALAISSTVGASHDERIIGGRSISDSSRARYRRDDISTEGCKTNADCLARGLPLRRPKWKGRRDVPPGTVITANILVLDTITNSSYGYLTPASPAMGGWYLSQPDRTSASIVTITTTDTNRQMNIRVNDEVRPWLSQSYDGGTSQLGPGRAGNTGISRFSQALQSGKPVITPASSYGSGTETAIWNYDLDTRALTSTWVEKDDSLVPLMFIRSGINGFLGGTGDYTKVSFQVRQVKFLVVPL